MGLDQLSKFFISSHLSLGESLNIFPFLNFTLIHNTGIAFSIFDEGGEFLRWLLVASVVGIMAYLVFLLYKKTPKHQLELVSLLLIISGGLGNLIDRLLLGYVVDFVHVFYQHYSFYVFNIADSYITLSWWDLISFQSFLFLLTSA